MHVVFLYGPPAVGKLTVANELSRRTALPVFHNHLAVDVALRLFPFGTDPFNRLREVVWITAFEEAALSGRSFIFTFCPEPTVPDSLLTRMHESIVGAGGRVVYVELHCPNEITASRVANEDRRQFGKLTDRNLFESLAASGGFESPTVLEPALRIDTGRYRPAESSTLIADLLDRIANDTR